MGGVATNKRILLKLSVAAHLYELIWVKKMGNLIDISKKFGFVQKLKQCTKIRTEKFKR